jgi:hypothetical protein
MIIKVKLSNGNIVEAENFEMINPNLCLIKIRGSKHSDKEVNNFVQMNEQLTSIVVDHIYEDESLNTTTTHKVLFELSGINLEVEDIYPETEDGSVDITRLVKEKVYTISLKPVDAQSRVSKLIDHVGYIENPNALNLEDFKEYYIGLSRTKLDEYLQSNPLEAKIQGRTKESYSITKEKQKLLSKEIMATNLAQQVGEQYQPSWNAKGEPLSTDWTIEQLLRLSFKITETVRPLVSAQQKLEVKIIACESIDDILKIELDYSGFDARNKNKKQIKEE